MPNEYAAMNLSRVPNQTTAVSIPGSIRLPTFRGRPLHIPLYHRNISPARFAEHGYLGGLGAVGAVASTAVGKGVASAATSFLKGFVSAIGSVISAIVNIVTEIINFIINTVVKLVTTLLSEVAGLVGAVLDAVGLMGDGDFSVQEAVQMGQLLTKKKDSLGGIDTPGAPGQAVDRPTTPEEQTAYDNNMKQSETGIKKLLKKVKPGMALLAAGGISALILLSSR